MPVQVQAVSDLIVVGTAGNDQIALSPGSRAGQVIAKLYGAVVASFGPTGHVIANGLAGNDILSAEGLSLAVVVYGGDGNDTLTGGAGGDLFIINAGTPSRIFSSANPRRTRTEMWSSRMKPSRPDNRRMIVASPGAPCFRKCVHRPTEVELAVKNENAHRVCLRLIHAAHVAQKVVL